MTIQEASTLIKLELKYVYPTQEMNALTDIIFKHLLGLKRTDQFLQANKTIPIDIQPQIYNIIEQLKSNRPIQYILGETEFYGLTFFVNESVLIPRPETEELVQWIVNDNCKVSPQVIDIGTGSGCIAVTLAKLLPNPIVFAADISDEAIETAKKNARHNEVNVEFTKLDILAEEVPDLTLFDVIVSNPPYVTVAQKQQIEKNVLDYEPHLALFTPENDPLVFYKAIGRFAKKNLQEDGTLYFEINEELAEETASCIEQLGFNCELKKDLNDKYRMLKAKGHKM